MTHSAAPACDENAADPEQEEDASHEPEQEDDAMHDPELGNGGEASVRRKGDAPVQQSKPGRRPGPLHSHVWMHGLV